MPKSKRSNKNLTGQKRNNRNNNSPLSEATHHNARHYAESLKRNPDFFVSDTYQAKLVKRKGFKNFGQYLDWLAKKRGFGDAYAYYVSKLAAKGIHSAREHQQLLAIKLGLQTSSQYQSHLKAKRAKNPRYMRFAEWLNECLLMLDKDYQWLAKKVHMSTEACRQYTLGFSIPRQENLAKIRYIFAQYAIPTVKLPEPPNNTTDIMESVDESSRKG